ncbi:MAG TPA: isoprenylcysteine carboxylmethyltransferase family protein [Aromatoleum sp.]|uniref:methyltransferase family protein n=1 Tax=Aromatoleum sp. TaxID=2307007 RepID=UPI002B458F2E|nr:isoprenylcysteine carboxylmethyltransferase family protein [Aromatoleum sp.]HJV26965.1 isoprenylcysteine carboxylmethyltransferase family protein [Aromatoleum sp.]
MSLPISDLPLFVSGTAGLLWLSRKPLRNPGSHGFYRFFAWESILALTILNRNAAGDQMFSESLLQLSVLPLLFGFIELRRKGKSDVARSEDTSLYGWEKTTELITGGVFGLIRHPMYSALLGLDWGMFFRAASWLGFGLALFATGSLLLTALADEKECIAYFGQAYIDYMRSTRRFIPWLF